MKRLFLHRLVIDEKYVWGVFRDENNLNLCESLELSWHNNQRKISCIPGNKSYISQFDPAAQKGKGAFWIYNVIDRDEIQIHAGNKTSDIQGCILPGYNFDDENVYIYDSTSAITKLFGIYQLEMFELVIVDASNKTVNHKDFKVISGDRRKWRDVGKPVVSDVIPVPTYDFTVNYKPLEKFWYKNGKYVKRATVIVVGLLGGVALIQAGAKEAGIALMSIFGGAALKDTVKDAADSNPAVDGKPGILYQIIEMILKFIKSLLIKEK